jgi:hypothetical protein
MTESVYAIPLAQRKTENLHIVFWLMKDISWCLMFRTLGVIMIVPTLVAAIYITWRARDIKTDLAHNLAVVFWISANAWWMVAEFFEFDEIGLWHGISGRHFALVPFAIGAVILLHHYLAQLIGARTPSLPQ